MAKSHPPVAREAKNYVVTLDTAQFATQALEVENEPEKVVCCSVVCLISLVVVVRS